MTDTVRITDVAPRDGLQNEPATIAVTDKARLVELLVAAGVDEVEVSSFVSPKWVPQLADAADLLERVADLDRGQTCFSVLVPNERGMAGALRVLERAPRRPIDKVAVFTAASETFCQKNINATVAESVRRFEPVIRMAHDAGLAVRGYVSCIVACPYEGAIAPGRVADVVARLTDAGVDEIDLGETIGAGTPDNIAALLDALIEHFGADAVASMTLHPHDTHGRAADCVRVAIERGLRSFDGAAGGLGGCPYASTDTHRAPGNIATETLVATVTAAGLATRVDADRLAEAGRFARQLVGRECGAEG